VPLDAESIEFEGGPPHPYVSPEEAYGQGGWPGRVAPTPVEEEPSPNSTGPVTEPAWEPVSIAQAGAEPPRRPERMSGLLYDDALTLVSGEPGVGKSMFLAAVVASEAMAGRTALYLDFEGTPGTLLERLEGAGLSDAQLGQILYLRPSVQAASDEIRAMVARLDPAFVALDSYDAALAAYGLETKNEDIRAFHSAVIGPLRSSGATVAVADHVAKNRETRGPYSIGGQSKLALADAHLGLVAIAPLRRGAGGKLKVKAHKDRHGWLPRSALFELTSHDVTGALSWNVNVEDEPGDADGWRPTVIMERASRYLEMQSGEVSQATVERDVQGKGAALRTALNRLVEDGYVEASEGPRGARLLRSLKPYREADE
jgi:AAA domain